VSGVFARCRPSRITPALELEILELWERRSTFERLHERNRGGPRWSFIDAR
jgi:hypothetical protein